MSQQGRGGMGSKKHGKSGIPPKSPKFRHKMKLEAERKENKSTKARLTKSVKELFNNYD